MYFWYGGFFEKEPKKMKELVQEMVDLFSEIALSVVVVITISCLVFAIGAHLHSFFKWIFLQ